MQIQINGHTKDFSNTPNIAGVIAQFTKDSSKIIAELNGTIVPTSAWSNTTVKEGDTIELVSFVGGG